MNISNSQTIIYSLGSEKRKRKRKLSNDSTGIIMYISVLMHKLHPHPHWNQRSRESHPVLPVELGFQ